MLSFKKKLENFSLHNFNFTHYNSLRSTDPALMTSSEFGAKVGSSIDLQIYVLCTFHRPQIKWAVSSIQFYQHPCTHLQQAIDHRSIDDAYINPFIASPSSSSITSLTTSLTHLTLSITPHSPAMAAAGRVVALLAVLMAVAAHGEAASVVVGLAKCSDCTRKNMKAEAAFKGAWWLDRVPVLFRIIFYVRIIRAMFLKL